MSKSKQLSGAERKAMLLETGAKLAAKYGATNVTRRMVANAAKVSEPLVSSHMGDTATAQRAYKRKCKALGLVEPDKAKQESIGTKLRAHKTGDKRDTRTRSAKEKLAIAKKKTAAPKVSAAKKLKPAKDRLAPALQVGSKQSESASVREIKPAPKPKSKPVKPKSQPEAPGPDSKPDVGPSETKTAARAPKAPPPTVDTVS